jgi:hypothetical protein
VKGLRASLAGIIAAAALAAGCCAPAAAAREDALTAIELYNTASGPAYVQLTDVLINDRAEMRDCSSYMTGEVDRAAYAAMFKVQLAAGGILDRGADGLLRYYAPSVSGGFAKPVCVLADNLRLERGWNYSLTALADQTVLQGTVANAGSGSLASAPPIQKGTKLVFIAALNVELAEFLRTQLAADVAGWQAYLAHYPTGQHATAAKHALASIYLAQGEAALQAYNNSLNGEKTSYADLKTAKARADKARALEPEQAASARLNKEIGDRLAVIAEQGHSELYAYRTALAAHTAGYVHLQNARRFSETVTAIDPSYSLGQALAEDVQKSNGEYDAALRSAGEASAAKQFDQAYVYVLPYRAFAAEDARLAAFFDAAYSYHIEHGKGLEQSREWAAAIEEFERAVAVKDTLEARELVKKAQSELAVLSDQAVVDKALAASKEFQAQHNMVRAYEVLASLPAEQQAKVADEMKKLEPGYAQGAAQEAKSLHLAHSPIRGVADEIGIEKAYQRLQTAYQISGNESYRDKMELDANELSAYQFEQAKHYLAKPGGTGTELGWAYLEEAAQLKAANLAAVRDTMVSASAVHAMRARLSIRVQFRDQTSQRESQGITGQLENAIAAGLENCAVPVKVVMAGEATALEPDFDLDGDVLDNHLSVTPTIEAEDSEYRAGEEQLPSEAWNRANRAYEKAQMELQTDQTALQGAEARGNRDEISRLDDAVREAQKSVEGAHITLDATPKSTTRDIIRPYTYHRKTININGAIQLQFRIIDSLSGQSSSLVPITREDHKKDVLLEDVKPEDTRGVKSAGAATDPAEFMTELENSARKELIEAVRKRVEELPAKIYQSAGEREKEDDLDGAGESYLRYLHLTREDKSPERAHAKQFLMENFNMRPETITP